MKKKTGIVKDKKIDIIGLWKNFINGNPQELSQEEEILNNQSISESNKKILLQSLKDEEKLANRMFKDYYKTTKLKPEKDDIPKVHIDDKVKQKSINSNEQNSINHEHEIGDNEREY